MLQKEPSHTHNICLSSHTMPLLNRPAHSKATLGDSSFAFAFSSVRNSIPNDVRCAPSLSSFKSRLTTYLFRSVYKAGRSLYICAWLSLIIDLLTAFQINASKCIKKIKINKINYNMVVCLYQCCCI